MKNRPLVVQIWLVCTGITLSVCGLMAILLPWTLQSFFTQQTYDILQDSQKNLSIVSTIAGPASALPDGLIYSKELTIQEGSVNILAEEPVPAISAFVSPEQAIILEAPGQTKPTSDFWGMSIKGVAGLQKMPEIGHIVISDAIYLTFVSTAAQ